MVREAKNSAHFDNETFIVIFILTQINPLFSCFTLFQRIFGFSINRDDNRAKYPDFFLNTRREYLNELSFFTGCWNDRIPLAPVKMNRREDPLLRQHRNRLLQLAEVTNIKPGRGSGKRRGQRQSYGFGPRSV